MAQIFPPEPLTAQSAMKWWARRGGQLLPWAPGQQPLPWSDLLGNPSNLALPPRFVLQHFQGPAALAPALEDGELYWCRDTLQLLCGQGLTNRPIGGTFTNYLINGGFDFAQRQTPATLTAVPATDSYAADRWKVAWQTTNVQYQRVDTDGALETGITARYYGTYKQVSGAGKFIVYQIIEGSNTLPLAGQPVTFPIKLKTSIAKTIRMAVLQVTSSGTVDTIPNPVNSAFGANSTDPTWGANVAVVGSVTSQSVTTAWTNFSVTVTAPSNAKNLILAVWTDSQFAINDTLSMTEAGLYVAGSAVTPWQPRPIAVEQVLVQRYCQKSYDIDVAPASTSANGSSAAVAINTSETYNLGYIFLATTMRITPSGLIYSFGTGAVGKAWDSSSSTDVSVSLANLGSSSFRFNSPGAFITPRAYFIQWILDAEL